MEELEELKHRLSHVRPVEWDNFPDIGLYMEQVLSYMPRQLVHYGGSDLLTSAMVNNYSKDILLPRAEGKRYFKEHLAYLTAICVLKQVVSVKNTGRLIAEGVHRQPDLERLYAFFCTQLDDALSNAAHQLDPNQSRDDLGALALRLALSSYADRLACERILDILQETDPDNPPPKSAKSAKPSKPPRPVKNKDKLK